MARKLVQNKSQQRAGNKAVKFTDDLISVKLKRHFAIGKCDVLKRATRENWIHDGTFHDAIAGLLVMAQLFAVMPVCGILSKDPKKLTFIWTSKRALYTYAMCLGTVFLSVNAVTRLFDRGFTFARLTVGFFYTYNLYATYCFILVARKWPAMIRKWCEVEQLLPSSTNILERGQLAYKIKMVSILVMTLSLMEHMLSITAAVFFTPNCSGITDPLTMFFKSNFLFVFYHFEYSKIRGFVVKCINVVNTFVWSYMDLFVIVISIGLSHTFKRVNDFMIKHKRKTMTEQFWGEQRQNYRNICDLVQQVDDVISIITMLSISNNLFFICASILNSLDSHPSIAHTVYFWFSLTYLIARTLAVTMYAAEVNDESKRPIEVLRTIPREGWCLEAKRFAEEVVNDTVALTGMKFFKMTRKLVLTVTGSIITYELVLIQFHQDDKGEVDLCKMKRT
ncbi:gustatory receptor for sugar taste 64f-like [Toxorhynchites rutilus septentrionalis]|uniref:gustatory receptor for sugar taste 64f-like n=1 Tax=Toxorhynchites rutilus septentrionalis TaxID=329112 RepID=UPI0024789A8F|nr:gustatory receptor for sugar taste 64f-like [Toxorhynchites rutilus septentrionalis]